MVGCQEKSNHILFLTTHHVFKINCSLCKDELELSNSHKREMCNTTARSECQRTCRRQELQSSASAAMSRKNSRKTQTHSICEPRMGLNACHRPQINAKQTKIAPLSHFPCYARLMKEGYESLKISNFRALFISSPGF